MPTVPWPTFTGKSKFFHPARKSVSRTKTSALQSPSYGWEHALHWIRGFLMCSCFSSLVTRIVEILQGRAGELFIGLICKLENVPLLVLLPRYQCFSFSQKKMSSCLPVSFWKFLSYLLFFFCLIFCFLLLKVALSARWITLLSLLSFPAVFVTCWTNREIEGVLRGDQQTCHLDVQSNQLTKLPLRAAYLVFCSFFNKP